MCAAARLLKSCVRIPPGAWMFVCCECCVLSDRGLCDELIIRPEESYRMWCVVCVWSRNLVNEKAMTRVGSQRHPKKKRDRENAQRFICHNDLLSKTACVKKAISKQFFFCFNAASSNVLEKMCIFTVSSDINLPREKQCCATLSILYCWQWHVAQQHTHKALLLSTGKKWLRWSDTIFRSTYIAYLYFFLYYSKVNQGAEGFLSLDNNMKLA
jgi:hypothetical protein